MISIQWLKFLFLISSFYFSTNYIFLTMSFSFSILYLQSYPMIFKNILSSSSFLFFPSSSSSSISFLLFPYFSFVLSLFSSFFSSQFALFPQFGLPFPKSAAPVLPHFLLPCPLHVYLRVAAITFVFLSFTNIVRKRSKIFLSLIHFAHHRKNRTMTPLEHGPDSSLNIKQYFWLIQKLLQVIITKI